MRKFHLVSCCGIFVETQRFCHASESLLKLCASTKFPHQKIWQNFGKLTAHYQVWDKFLATKITLKMMKNAFYFILNDLFVVKIFKLLPLIFSHVEKQLHWKDKVRLKFFDITTWDTDNCSTQISQKVKAIRQWNSRSY